MNGKKRLPLTVWMLGLVSLFTDTSSEMIYPLLPIFLSSVLGAGAVELGVIEGVAETTASLLKLYSGAWTDRTRRRKPFVLFGYGLAGMVRPLIGIAGSWPTVLGLRFLDRIGKGVRTSPRDALIADAVPIEQHGAAFGLHQAMDHLGAVAGPLLATLLLSRMGLGLRTVFLLASIPAALAFAALLWGVREKARDTASPGSRIGVSILPWSELPPSFKRVLAILILFTLGNSTDAFLLLRLSDAGIAPAGVAALWAALHVVKSAANLAGGWLTDRMPRVWLMAAGWWVYALVYAGFAYARSTPMLIGVFLSYGIYFGLTEPSQKAWVAESIDPAIRGSAFGFYNLAIGIAALPASLLFGAIWKAFTVQAAFLTGAGLAAAAALLLLSLVPGKRIRPSAEI